MRHQPTPPAAATAWVVAADHADARLFEVPVPTAPLRERLCLHNAAEGLPEAALVSDRQGQLRGPGRGGAHAANADVHVRDHEAERFAARVADTLEQLRVDGALARLYVVAEADFLGLLRRRMKKTTREQVQLEVPRDYTHRSAADIRALLPVQL